MPVTMFDDIRIDLIPAGAQAVAGYVNGRWPTYNALVKQFPHARHLSIAVTANADADCLDCEQGDATPDQAPPWVRRQFLRGVKRPVVYTSVSQAPAVLAVLAKAGIPRSAIRLWTAHYTGKQHICSPACGFGFQTTADATQWTDTANNRSLDASLCNDDFFGPSPKPVRNRRAVWASHLRDALHRDGLLHQRIKKLKHLVSR